MKRLPALVAVSLVTNLLLAAAWWSAPPSTDFVPDSSGAPAPSSVDSATDQVADFAEAPPLQSWADISRGLGDSPADDVILVNRLREAHFAPDVIRSILSRRVDERYADTEAALIASQPPVRYWDTTYNATRRGTMEVRSALRQLRREKSALLDQLLGPSAESPESIRSREKRYGPLPRETANRLADLLSDYRDLEAEARANMQGTRLPSDREDLELIAAARERDIADLLTPAQLEAYQLRSGQTSRSLRNKLAGFQPSKAEFLSLRTLQVEFDSEWGSSFIGLTREQRQERSAAQKELNTRIADTLGEERYSDYEQLTSGRYRYTKRLTDRLDLPSENALRVTQLQSEFDQANRALRRDRSLSPENRLSQQNELQQRARAQLNTLLTEPGLSAYESSPIGRWIGALTPAPRPTPPGGN